MKFLTRFLGFFKEIACNVIYSLPRYYAARKHYTFQLKKVNKNLSKQSLPEIKNDKIKLEEYIFLKDVYLSRFLNYNLLPLIIILIFIICVYLLQKVNSTKIYAEIYVSGFAVKTSSYYDWGKYAQAISAKRIFYNSDNSDETVLNSGKEVKVQLKNLSIPAGAIFKMNNNIHSELLLVISDTGSAVLRGAVKDSFETSIPITKAFADRINFELYLSEFDILKISKFYVNNIIDFNENSPTNDQPYSGVDSGYIKLLDTNNEYILLEEGDSLKIHFKETPVKLNILTEKNHLKLSFEAEVDQLKAGPAILNNTEQFNKMPTRIKTIYDKFPYAYAIAIALLPFLIPLLFRQRRAL